MNILLSISWPLLNLGDAMEALARARGLLPQEELRAGSTSLPPAELYAAEGGAALSRWIELAADRLSIEVEPVQANYGETRRLLENAGPALLYIPVEGEMRFLALLGSGRGYVSVLGCDLRVHRIEVEVVRRALFRNLESLFTADLDRLLKEAGVPLRRREQAREAILRERLSSAQIGGCWLLGLRPTASLRHQIKHSGSPGRFFKVIAANAALYLLSLLSWWIIGRSALADHNEMGLLMGWALILLTIVPIRMIATWSQGLLATGAGSLLKQCLLRGALNLGAEEIRHQGTGEIMGRVFESEAVESLALGGGFVSLFAAIELLLAVWVLSQGAAGWLHPLLLILWVFVVLLMSWSYYRRRLGWTVSRVSLTNDLLERMVGHRTRLAQQPREGWHEEEDISLSRYVLVSEEMDRAEARLAAVAPRGWLIVGLIGLAPALVGSASTQGRMAVTLGGVLFAFHTFQKLASGLSQIAGAIIGCGSVRQLVAASTRRTDTGLSEYTLTARERGREEDEIIIDAQEISFRYHKQGEPVLKGCSLQVKYGDKILLEGPSGGGKSTLGSLLAGLRVPESGLLLVYGLDRKTLGSDGWRRRIATAPQFHENHVITETFAFNLLMGRGWPPSAEDMEEAEAICRELGLGDLLERMPAGLLQMVGETGWQLSHGERSRLYIARALLQGADLVILDESFAALDPETLRLSLRCVLNRASTLIVIAHP